MPVDPREFEGLIGLDPTVIQSDRKCTGCRRTLKGLPVEGVCPKCRTPIRRSKTLARSEEAMVSAPPAWLRNFALGATLMLISAVVLVSCILLRVASTIGGGLAGIRLTAAIIALGTGVVWNLGTWLVSRPRPTMPGVLVNPAQEWIAARWICRLLQPALIAWAACDVAQSEGTVLSGIDALKSNGLASVGMMLWMFGVGSLCLLLSRYAFWAGDSQLAFRLRTQMILVVVAGLVSLIPFQDVLFSYRSMPDISFGSTNRGAMAQFMAMFPVLVIFTLIYGSLMISTLGWGMYCLYRLRNLASWARHNQLRQQLRDEQLRAKTQAEFEAYRGTH